jgi:Domain of Unknown Function with PDB structure (DUF3857)/Transglutaminase-like superfamily
VRAVFRALLIVVTGFTGLRAQAPRITPAGDPSIKNDTIYRLVVNPADHPNESFVYLLDDGVIRVETDGRGSRTYRQVVQILTREAAERWGEQAFSYDSSRERFTLNWARVLASDGRVISEQPSHEQESTAPVAASAPVYSDVRVHRVTLAGVQPGTLVDYSITVETVAAIMPGDFHNTWRVTTGSLTRRSRFVVDAPADLPLKIEERNLNFRRRMTSVHGRRVYLWATAEVPRIEGEPYAADSNDVVGTVRIGAPISWADVARWYAGLARDRYHLGPALAAEVARIVAPGRTLDDTLRLLHRWVAQDFRYVSLSLGIGGYQPHAPDSVFAARYGDCKDKATLFIAAAGRLGVRAYPVLLSARERVDRELPSTAAFDHMIAAIDRHESYVYVDLTAGLVPFGLLPTGDQGRFGLVVHPDGRAEEVTLPQDSAGANRMHLLVAGSLSPAGALSGRVTVTAQGAVQAGLRSLFEAPLSEAQATQAAQGMASKVARGATGDSLEAFDGRDLQVEPRLAFAVHLDHALKPSGDRDILTLPLPDESGPGIANALATRPTRRFPIDGAKVVGLGEVVDELRLQLPNGWTVDLPPSVNAISDFGTYEAKYTQEGNVLHVIRRMRGSNRIEPPSRIADLIAWLKQRAQDDVSYVVLRRS